MTRSYLLVSGLHDRLNPRWLLEGSESAPGTGKLIAKRLTITLWPGTVVTAEERGAGQYDDEATVRGASCSVRMTLHEFAGGIWGVGDPLFNPVFKGEGYLGSIEGVKGL
jgi:hypothetical protein